MSESAGWQDDFGPDAAKVGFRVFSAEMSALPEIIQFVIEQGHGAALPAADCARLAILIEELFINSVTHGTTAGSSVQAAGSIRLALDGTRPGQLRVSYQDRGVAFNPLTDGPEIPDTREAAERYLADRTGGVGLWLLRHYARDSAYRRVGGVNCVQFQLGGSEAAT